MSGKALAGRFMAHRRIAVELARLLPESAAAYKPWEGAMSTLELLTHIAGATEFLLAPLLDREPHPLPPVATLADAARCLDETGEAAASEIAGLTDEQLAKVVTHPALNMTFPLAILISGMIDHEVHHKGQAFVYARMLGIEPPDFIAH